MADFDVLCLQEIAQGYADMPGAPGDQPAELQALLPGYQLFFGAAVDEFDAAGRRMRFGNLIATRLPVTQVQHHALPWPADGGVRSMPRMCTVVTVQSPALGAVRVMTTHLEYYSQVQRMAQARALRELHVEACGHAACAAARRRQPLARSRPRRTRPHAILCGDFNLGRDRSPEYAAIQQPLRHRQRATRLRDAWRVRHGEHAARADLPPVRPHLRARCRWPATSSS